MYPVGTEHYLAHLILSIESVKCVVMEDQTFGFV
jgi:hypothetical protein